MRNSTRFLKPIIASILLSIVFIFAGTNDSKAQTVFLEDFELGVPGSFTAANLSGGVNWANSTRSTGGIGFPFNGNSVAALYSTQGGNAGAMTELVSGNIDLSAGRYVLSFWYAKAERNGSSSDIAAYLSIDGGANWILIDSIIDPTTSWVNAEYDLDNFATTTTTCKIRLIGINLPGWRMGLDDVAVYRLYPSELAVSALLDPSSGCGMSAAESISILVENKGFNPASNIPVTYTLNGMAGAMETITGPIPAGGDMVYQFSTTSDLSAFGDYDLKAWASLVGDPTAQDDTVTKTVTNVPVVSAFPISRGFEGGQMDLGSWKTAIGPQARLDVDTLSESIGTYGLKFEGGARNGQIWPNSSSSSTTAAQAWSVYTDNHASATMCIDASTSTAGLELSFDMRQNSSVGNGFRYNWFRVLVNGVQISPDFHPNSANSDPWQNYTYNLSQYAGFSFEVTFQSSCKYNVAAGVGDGDQVMLDNIMVEEKFDLDGSVTSFMGLNSGCAGNPAQNIVVEYTNVGYAPITTFDLAYRVNGGPITTLGVTTNLSSGQSGTFDFNVMEDFSAFGTYLVEAWASLGGDIVSNNDTLEGSAQTGTFQGIPYAQNWDGSNPFDTVFVDAGSEAAAAITTTAQTTGLFSFRMEGTNAATSSQWPGGSANSTTAMEAWGDYDKHHSSASMCIDATNTSGGLELLFDLKQTSSDANGRLYNWFRVTVDGNQVSPDYNPMTENADPFRTISVNLTPFAGTKFTLSFENSAKYGEASGVGVGDVTWIDNIKIDTNNLINGAAASLADIESGCNLSANTPVSLEIRNDGFIPLTNFQVGLSVDGLAPSIETFSGSISAGMSAVHNFTSGANLSVLGDHVLKTWIYVPSDVNAFNDTISTTIKHYGPSTTPIIEDFEGGAGAISTIQNAKGNWLQVGPTVVPGIGLSGTSGMLLGGSPFNMGPDWDGDNNNTSAAQAWSNVGYHSSISYCVDASALSTSDPLVLAFDLRQTASVGTDLSWFRVNINGVQITPNYKPVAQRTDPYARHIFDIRSYAGTSFEIQFQSANRYNALATGTGDADQSFVDNIEIRPPHPNDAAPNEIYLTGPDCLLGKTEPLAVNIENKGTAVLSNMQICLIVDGGTPIIEIVAGPIAAGAIASYNFTATADLSAVGPHIVTVITKLGGDGNSLNDTITQNFETKGVLSSFPYLVDFEFFNPGLFDIIPGSEGNAVVDQVSGNNGTFGLDIYGWDVNTTNTSGLSWDGNTTFQDVISSELSRRNGRAKICVDATNESNLEMFFDMRQYTTFNNNYSFAWVLVDGQPISDVNGTMVHTVDANNAWRNMHYDLTAFVGKVFDVTIQAFNKYERGFSAQGQTHPEGDAIHVDNVLFRNYLADDVGVSAIISPVEGCGLTSSEDVIVEITNYGTDAVTTFDVIYTLNGASQNLETWSGNLASGAITTYLFSAPADMSSNGVYMVDAWTSYSKDEDTSNDAASTTVENGLVNSFPYFENFEAFIPGAGASGFINRWRPTSSSNYSWLVDANGTPSNNTGPNDDHSLTGPGIYLYAEASNMNFGDEALITSPCMELGTMSAPVVSFWYHMAGNDINELQMDVDDGSGAVTLLSIKGAQQASSNSPWLSAYIDIRQFAGKTVQLSFRAIRGGANIGDIAIDDLRVFQAPALDGSLTALTSPVGPCLDETEILSIEFRNAGSASLDLAMSPAIMTTNISGAAIASYITTFNSGVIAPGATAVFVVDSFFDMSASGDYFFDAAMAISSDAVPVNDIMTTAYLRKMAAISTFQGVDFTGFDGSNLGTLFNGWTEGNGGAGGPTFGNSNWGLAYSVHLAHYGDDHARLAMLGNNVNEWLVSPMFTPTVNDSIVFDVALTGYIPGTGGIVNIAQFDNDDALRLMVTTDCGATWSMLDIIDVNDNVDTSFRYFGYDLTPFAGMEIALGWWASTGANDGGLRMELHIDDINITQPRGSVTTFNLLSPADGATVRIEGDGNQTLDLGWERAFSSLSIPDNVLYEVHIGTLNGSMVAPILTSASANSGVDTSFSLTYADVAMLLRAQGVDFFDTLKLHWTVVARSTFGIDTVFANKPFAINLIRGIITGVDPEQLGGGISLYPNPANDFFNLKFDLDSKEQITVEVFNLLGDKVFLKGVRVEDQYMLMMNSAVWPSGMYLINVKSESGLRVSKRVIVQH